MRILWLKTELLHPVDKGGKIRTYEMLKHLRRDHEITYLTLANAADPREARERAREYCERLITIPWSAPRKLSASFYRDIALNLASPLPYAIAKYRSKEMSEAIAREVSSRYYDVAVCDFLAPSVNFPNAYGSATVLFQHNIESMIWRRHFETQINSFRRGFFHSQWKKMYRYERATSRRFDAVVAVSELDRDQMRDEFGLDEVYDVPTGVDTDYFKPSGDERNPLELVFTGSMDWMPNEDAIIHFAKEILPVISRSIPTVTLTVVGRNPGPRLKELERSNPKIKITGFVEDIRPYVSRAAACIVPVRIGGGTRLKIYEAMAMAKPVVSTSVGAEGLPVRDNEDLLIADGPDEFARAVVRVLTDSALAERLSRRARALVCERFGWEHAAARFAEVCELAAGQKPRLRAA